MSNFDKLRREAEAKKIKDQAIADMSKNKLYHSAKTKILTTMIGALESIEKKFGFLWESEKLTEEQEHFRVLYNELRCEILDRGNAQIRNLEADFSHYEIVNKRFYTHIPFRRG